MTKNRQQGFTLIELMIVVLTLAILATIAYPSYETYVRQTRLENVRADLLVSAQSLERQYAQQHHFPASVASNSLESNQYFNIRYKAAIGDDFTLIAEPNENNPNEKRHMQLNGSGIITVCEGRTAATTSSPDVNCYVYK
ncbi:type IV pilin protein [Neisseria zoodegmatis]|uniref:Type IV pilin protein n=1 Tax=Neisseria zoodegmatis TaxID=326523 RepID=A0A378WIY2_9NEIS|nr:type IV pilin protein [Neisseria zoodegmatis]SUA36551.1 type IV pilin protein [Neisseria zoodegmatis]